MKYIVMCGCAPDEEKPKQLFVKGGEELAARTIRLLRQEGVTDIVISSPNPAFKKFGVPVIDRANAWYDTSRRAKHYWVDGFMEIDEPVCYVFGDVYFSPEAIHKIVTTETAAVEFFASAPPFYPNYPKHYAEPFAFKVVDQEHFRESIAKVKILCDTRSFDRHPCAWELWQVIKGTRINEINYNNYTVINDYTCDIDSEAELERWP